MHSATVANIGNVMTMTMELDRVEYGWPFFWLQQPTDNPWIHRWSFSEPYRLEPLHLVANAAVLLAAVLSAAFVSERWLRRRPKRIRFHLADIFILIAVVAGLFAGREIVDSDWPSELSWYLQVTLVLAFASMIYTGGWLVVRLARNLYALAVRRSP